LVTQNAFDCQWAGQFLHKVQLGALLFFLGQTWIFMWSESGFRCEENFNAAWRISGQNGIYLAQKLLLDLVACSNIWLAT
jgi:hypothetical protein